MQRKDRIDALGGGLLVLFSLITGLNQALIKIVNQGLQPIFQAGLRSAAGFVLVLLFAVVMKRRLNVRDGSLLPGIVCGLLFAGEFILLFQALDYTSVSRASVFFYTMPFWVAIFAHFLFPGERLSVVRVTGLVLAMAGVAWALLHNAAPASEHALWGDLACLAASFFWAGIVLVVRTTHLSRSCPEQQLLYQLCVSALVLLPLALVMGEPVRDFTPQIAAVFGFQVIAVVCFTFLGWFWVLSIYPASDMASFGFLAPVFGVMFGWLLLGETLSRNIVGALVLVSVGIVLINRKPAAG
jgi:drug/metabolite transporter (DMT)-like permease